MLTSKTEAVISSWGTSSQPHISETPVYGPVPEASTAFGYRLAKRSFDLIVALLLVMLLSPLFLLIYIAIKLDDGGPVLLAQTRVGLGGKVFQLYKFRSMTAGVNHTQKHQAYAQKVIRGEVTRGPNSNGGLLKPTADRRIITRVGKILRKSSLDELPQLFNVIKGEMSLVGPRPSMNYEVEAYYDWYLPRLSVLPGITGLAQINGRSSVPFPEIVRMDLEYIQKRSLWLDLRILLKTPLIVFSMQYAG